MGNDEIEGGVCCEASLDSIVGLQCALKNRIFQSHHSSCKQGNRQKGVCTENVQKAISWAIKLVWYWISQGFRLQNCCPYRNFCFSGMFDLGIAWFTNFWLYDCISTKCVRKRVQIVFVRWISGAFSRAASFPKWRPERCSGAKHLHPRILVSVLLFWGWSPEFGMEPSDDCLYGRNCSE